MNLALEPAAQAGIIDFVLAPPTEPENARAGGRTMSLDHLGVAVRSIADARIFYELLGLSVMAEETIEFEQVKVAMVALGSTRVELLEPTAEDSPVGRFLAKRGEGMHHVALKTNEIDAVFQRLRGQGIRLVSERIRTGAGGHRYFFVHPQSNGGVLLEIVDSYAPKDEVEGTHNGLSPEG